MSDRGEVKVELPRRLFGGLRKGPVDDLLRRIAHDYELLEIENRKLWATLEQLGQVDEPDGNNASVDAGATRDDARSQSESGTPRSDVTDPGAVPAGASTTVGKPHSQRDANDLAAAVLLLAQRAANELRDSARAECELMLKKARVQAEKLERETRQSRVATERELAELQAMRGELRDQMSASLQALLRTFVAERSGELPEFEWRELPSFLELDDPDRPRGKKKKHKR
jgi:cell division septum initiation protein DivIVA